MRTIAPLDLCKPYFDRLGPALPWPPENMMTTIERKCVLAVAMMHDKGAKAIIEFGTFEGFTTALLARAFPNKLIYTVDLPSHVAHKEQPGIHLGHHYKSNNCNNVVQILQQTMELDPETLEECDFALVDADHELDSVYHDVGIAMFLLAKGGGLMLDDCFMPGPAEVIRQTELTYPEIGFIQIQGTKLAYATV